MNRSYALGRLPAGTMNKTEAAYAALLESEKQAGRVLWFKFEPMSLRLARLTSYKPDFLVMSPDRTLAFHEVKGFWQDDARVKIKVAAEQFPMFRFVGVRLVKKQWVFEEF